MSLKRNQVGDTIIEVMLAVGIVGLAIAGGYGIATRSLKQARQAQERGEALKLAEGQIEGVKALLANSDTFLASAFTSSDPFCISETNDVVPEKTFSDIPEIDADTLGPPENFYKDGCIEGLYHIAVEAKKLSVMDTVTTYNVKASVRWFSLGNSGIEQVQINYHTFRSSSP